MSNIMKFYYIDKLPYINEYKPINSFKAFKIKIDGVTKFYPIIDYTRYNEIPSKVFVRGIGYKKVGTKSIVDIPVFDGNVEHWNEYREKYGDNCLFFSLCGYDLQSNDVVVYRAIREYYSITQTKDGIEHYTEYTEIYNRINEIQINSFEKWRVVGYNNEFFYSKLLFKPCVELYGFSIGYMPDPIKDNKIMEGMYFHYRNETLKEKRYNKEIQSTELRRKIDNEIHTQIIKELADDSGNGEFPFSIKDRMKYFFGEEVMNLYEKLFNIINKKL